MSHAVVRTSPKGKGSPFIGRCHKCGQEGLGMAASLEPCPEDGHISDGQALLDILAESTEEASHD